jgi:hypothetical protein
MLCSWMYSDNKHVFQKWKFKLTTCEQNEMLIICRWVRLHLWTAANNRPIVHPPGDIWVWRTWWNDNVVKGKTTDSTTSDIWQQVGGTGERDENLALHNISVHTCKWYFTCCKILWHGASGFIPLQRKACCGFLSPLKIHRLGRVWTRKPWVQWQTH